MYFPERLYFLKTIIKNKKRNILFRCESKEMGEEVFVVVLRQIKVQLFGGKLSPCSYLIN